MLDQTITVETGVWVEQKLKTYPEHRGNIANFDRVQSKQTWSTVEKNLKNGQKHRLSAVNFFSNISIFIMLLTQIENQSIHKISSKIEHLCRALKLQKTQ